MKLQFFVNINSISLNEGINEESNSLFKKLSGNTKYRDRSCKEGLQIYSQSCVAYVPKVETRVKYLGFRLPLIFLQNQNPKIIDRRILKMSVQVDSIINLNISILCGSCRQLKNDCNCEKSHYMVKCFVNLIGRSGGIPLKLCIRKMGVLFSLLDVTPYERIILLGYLIKFDRLKYSLGEFVKFTDIRFKSNIGGFSVYDKKN